jgi:putative FmdB family regulatory protein
MPIYAYRCEHCGHARDVMQKLSEAPLAGCPACGADAFRKQLTAAAFQLKGSGWYATDFRDNGKAKPAKPEDAVVGDGKGDASKADREPATAASGASAGMPAAGSEPAKPAAAAAASPAPGPVASSAD